MDRLPPPVVGAVIGSGTWGKVCADKNSHQRVIKVFRPPSQKRVLRGLPGYSLGELSVLHRPASLLRQCIRASTPVRSSAHLREIVMPRMEGTLDAFLSKVTVVEATDTDIIYRLPGGTRVGALSLLHQLAVTMCEMHSMGMVHGDVKCSNILYRVDEENEDMPVQLYMSDFGMTHMSTSCAESHRIASAVVLSPPEFLLRSGRARWGMELDMWCFGNLIVKMATRDNPFAPKKKEVEGDLGVETLIHMTHTNRVLNEDGSTATITKGIRTSRRKQNEFDNAMSKREEPSPETERRIRRRWGGLPRRWKEMAWPGQGLLSFMPTSRPEARDVVAWIRGLLAESHDVLSSAEELPRPREFMNIYLHKCHPWTKTCAETSLSGLMLSRLWMRCQSIQVSRKCHVDIAFVAMETAIAFYQRTTHLLLRSDVSDGTLALACLSLAYKIHAPSMPDLNELEGDCMLEDAIVVMLGGVLHVPTAATGLAECSRVRMDLLRSRGRVAGDLLVSRVLTTLSSEHITQVLTTPTTWTFHPSARSLALLYSAYGGSSVLERCARQLGVDDIGREEVDMCCRHVESLKHGM